MRPTEGGFKELHFIAYTMPGCSVGRDEGACLLGVGNFSLHCLFVALQAFSRLKKFGLGYLSKPEYVLSSDLCSYLSSALFAGVVSFFGGVHGFRSPEGVFGLGWPPPLPLSCRPCPGLTSRISGLFSSAITLAPWGVCVGLSGTIRRCVWGLSRSRRMPM